ncbi:hypothetical protein BGX38DRAFT_1171169 [Terfezia claveryi]|nr:hypothetical protein BGX38DRAFT_1171169 [Terfezia claveryi]
MNKVVVFDVDNLGVDGKILDVVCRDQSDPHGVSDELLRWHFRQSVLPNMRGAGEPVFEHDFVGKDMVREISSGQYGQERFRNGSGSERMVNYVYCGTEKGKLQAWRAKLDDWVDPTCRKCGTYVETGNSNDDTSSVSSP